MQSQQELILNVEPNHSDFDVAGGRKQHDVVNNTEQRYAIKVKCSNNDSYRVSTVFAFVEPNGRTQLEIQRLPGHPPSKDRFVVQWAEVPLDETDAKAPFVAQAQSGEVIFNVEAKAEGEAEANKEG